MKDMRNLKHIQLKDLEEVDIDKEEEDNRVSETDDDFDYESEIGQEIYTRGGHGRGSLRYLPSRIFNFATATNYRKSFLLIILAAAVISFTILVSISTNSKDPKATTTDDQGIPFVFTNNRLPTWITPLHYLVYTYVDFKNFVFNGTTIITLNITKDDNYIVIHSESLIFDTVQLQPIDLNDQPLYPESSELNPYNVLIPDKMTYDTNNSYNILYFKQLPKLITENRYHYFQLRLTYRANLTDSLKGLYRSRYHDKGETKWMALTQFEPTDARAAFPCFDEPHLKAKWTIWLNIDAEYQALSNMEEVDNLVHDPYNNDDGSRKVVKFATTPLMSSYLVCMVVHQFSNTQTYLEPDLSKTGVQKDGITFRVWAAPGLLGATDYALQIAKSVTQYYIKYFNIAYPLRKMDLIAIPDFAAGAMENWGCITFRQTDLLYDPISSDVDNKARVAEVVAHEIAHQWFGDLTTMVWWSDLWLNEAFATFMSFKAMSAIITEFNSTYNFLYTIKQVGMKMDSQLSTHPIANNFTNPLDIEGAFDSITYDKGASVISMLESLMQVNGVDYFQNGIRSYLIKYSYSNAATADLWDSLFKAIKPYKDLNIPNIMKSWVNEPGYPYLNVTIISSKYIITQNRFVESDSNADYHTIWTIPLTYQTKCATVQNGSMFDSKETYLYASSNCLNLFMLNSNSKAFYRTFYSDLLFDLIVDDMNSHNSTINDLGRLTFLDDTFHFVQANRIAPSRLLGSLNFLSTQRPSNPVIWKTVIKGLNYITDRVYEQDYYQKYEYFIQNILYLGLLNQLGVSPRFDDDYNHKQLTKIAFGTSVNYNIDTVVSTLHSIWADYKDNVSHIQTELRGCMYKSIVKNGGEDEYNWVYKRYKETTSINERIDALRALGTSRIIHLIQRSLTMLTTGEIRYQDFGELITQLAFNPIAIDRTWRFMKEKYNFFKDRLLPTDLIRYYQNIGNNFNSQGQLDDFNAFFQDKSQYLPQSSIKNTIETIQNNIDWIEKNTDDIRNYLNQNN